MSTVTIPLQKPIQGHAGLVREIVVRPPTFAEYREFLDPFTIARSADGTTFVSENPDAIRGYMDALVVEPKDPLLLRQADFSAARALKDAILGFFLAGRPGDEASDEESKTLSTNSSSMAGAPSERLISIV